MKAEELAVLMGVSGPTIYKWFTTQSLDKRTALALAQIGCAEPQTEEPAQETLAKRSVRGG